MFISSLAFLRLSFLPVRASFIACPKAAKAYKGTVFCYDNYFEYILLFTFPFEYVYTVLFGAKIVLISAILYYALTKEQMNAL